jgi:hypothetical protein
VSPKPKVENGERNVPEVWTQVAELEQAAAMASGLVVDVPRVAEMAANPGGEGETVINREDFAGYEPMSRMKKMGWIRDWKKEILGWGSQREGEVEEMALRQYLRR